MGEHAAPAAAATAGRDGGDWCLPGAALALGRCWHGDLSLLGQPGSHPGLNQSGGWRLWKGPVALPRGQSQPGAPASVPSARCGAVQLLWVTLLGQGVGLGDPQRALPTPTTL